MSELNDPSHPDWRYSGSDLRTAKAERDAALAEVTRLREALTEAKPWLRGLSSMTDYDGLRWSKGQVADLRNTIDLVTAALAEGSR